MGNETLSILTMEHSAAALASYDAGAAAREAAWDAATTTTEVNRLITADRAAEDLVRVAFHKDTSDRNTLDGATHTNIQFVRRMVADFGPAV